MAIWNTLLRLARHRWLDQSDARRAVAPDAAERLRQRVAASEQRHAGEIRVCIEGGLPASYLWRHLRQRLSVPELVRQRALMMFSKLRVWDTEHNSGVLIYLLLAERAIELVADRGLAQRVPAQTWRDLADRLGAELGVGHFEKGLADAIDTVDALLTQHFPADPDRAGPNELPDEPILQ